MHPHSTVSPRATARSGAFPALRRMIPALVCCLLLALAAGCATDSGTAAAPANPHKDRPWYSSPKRGVCLEHFHGKTKRVPCTPWVLKRVR